MIIVVVRVNRALCTQDEILRMAHESQHFHIEAFHFSIAVSCQVRSSHVCHLSWDLMQGGLDFPFSEDALAFDYG